MNHSPRETSEYPANSNFYGDGGNRTHGLFPPWILDVAGFARGLPLHDRSGVIRAFAMVDAPDYERLSGFRWCIDNSATRYAKRTLNGRAHFLHREIAGLDQDDPRRVDHEDRDPLNCTRANLRLATTAQNAQNQGSRGGSSRHRGVTWDKSRQKWMATAMLNGRRRTIGRYDTEQEAAHAAAAWRAQHMPFSEEARAA